jgi:YebC/PmpR family DNA-binding regulatory protein
MGRAFEYRKATKFARWDKMAKAFTRAGRDIAIAIKQGGGANPEGNTQLRRAIQNAKAVQMPKDRIEAAIKRATSKDAEDLKEMVYQGNAPHGIALVVESTTDNPVRTVANIRAILNKRGGELGTQNMHDFLFDRKGVFFIAESDLPQGFQAEDFELEFIEYGLDSLEKDELDGKHYWVVYVAFEDFGTMQDALEAKKINVEKSELQRIPKHTRKLTAEQTDEVLELIDKLEQDDDVSEIFHNLDLSQQA